MLNTNKLVAVAILTAVFSATTFATNVPLDFTGWDSAILSTNGGSQVFTDVIGTTDVTVTTTGEFDATTSLVGSSLINSQHNPGTNSSSHSFTFCFSDPVDVIVNTFTLDADEQYDIFSDGAESYTHLSGAAPNVTPFGFGLLLDGVAYGLDPVTGAANGETHITGANCFTVTYSGLASIPKFGTFSVSSVMVPEPSSAVLFLIGGLGLLRRRRRK